MQFNQFVDLHRPALERDEIKNNTLLSALERGDFPGLRLWSVGGPGECAIQMPGRFLFLGDLSETQCHALADETIDTDYPGVVGAGNTAVWFVDRAVRLGACFSDPNPMQVHALYAKPHCPATTGFARKVDAADLELFLRWTFSFLDEALPDDPRPSAELLGQSIGSGRHFFWMVEDKPVAMASISPRSRNVSAINAVYTPPPLRARGYAGAITSALANIIFDQGKTSVCLYTDLRNPYSNRCYAKIGFVPICDLWRFSRLDAMGGAGEQVTQQSASG